MTVTRLPFSPPLSHVPAPRDIHLVRLPVTVFKHMHIASCTPPSVRASVLLSDPQVLPSFTSASASFASAGFYSTYQFLFCVIPLSLESAASCKLLPNRCSRSRSSLRLGALAGQCQRQRQPERQCLHCAVQASGRRSSSHPIPPAQWEVHNVF